VVTSVVTLSRLVHAALETAPAQTFAFFFGLIAASAVVLYGQVSVRTAGQAGAAVAGFVTAFAVTGVSGTGVVGHALPVIFLAGTVAITAMVLPGISGAFLLLLLGQYDYLTGVLSEFVDSLFAALTGSAPADVLGLASVVVTFCLGAVVGLFTVAHLIRRALDRYRGATLVFLVSLMAGSLRLPASEVLAGVETWTPAAAASVGVAALIGAGAVVALDRYTAGVEPGPE
jgi:putative membrane protein